MKEERPRTQRKLLAEFCGANGCLAAGERVLLGVHVGLGGELAKKDVRISPRQSCSFIRGYFQINIVGSFDSLYYIVISDVRKVDAYFALTFE